MKTNIVHCGDALQIMRTWPDQCVNCCVTSPPYWGLRDYGTATWEGGSAECDHKEPPGKPRKQTTNAGSVGLGYKDICPKCGAKRVDQQLGLEKTPEEFVAKMVEIFAEVRRVLKDDGTLWLNMGDSYIAGKTGSGGDKAIGLGGGRKTQNEAQKRPDKKAVGMKTKDLVGIPWMVAFALRQTRETHLVADVLDRAYLGGLVDGEGCITILRTKSSHCESYSYPPIVQVRMCDIEAIDAFAGMIDVKRSEAELYNSHKNNNQRPSYTVKATAQKAMDLIADIYPYLRVKRPQAIVAYNHQLYRAKTNYQPRSKQQIEREIFCKKLINDLNQRVARDLPSWMVEPQFKTEPGWYLRQDCIWHKPNPMPESVGDRCTKAHEYIFLLSKSAKYYCDMEAIKEDAKDAESYSGRAFRGPKAIIEAGGRPGQQQTIDKGCPADGKTYAKVNKRSVWTVTTKPYSEAHFATFPPDLIEPCVLAGCPENVCKKCDKPRVRTVEKSGGTTGESWHDHEDDIGVGIGQKRNGIPLSTSMAQKMKENPYKVETTGWTDCGCNAGFRPGIVLDPFYGSGTTGMVAYNNRRDYVGIELNPEYIKLDRGQQAQNQMGLFK